MRSLPATVVSTALEGPLDWPVREGDPHRSRRIYHSPARPPTRPNPLLVLLAILAGAVRGNLTLLHTTAVTDRWGTGGYGRLVWHGRRLPRESQQRLRRLSWQIGRHDEATDPRNPAGIRVGYLYEDCPFHPVLCTEIDDDGGVLLNGARSCDAQYLRTHPYPGRGRHGHQGRPGGPHPSAEG